MRDLCVSFPRPCDQNWEGMAPAGCARICAKCDTAVHDLSQYELGEAEALLRENPSTCVRARIRADGRIALKPRLNSVTARMMIAVAATAGVLAAGEPALARQDRPEGAIAGHIAYVGVRVRVTATGAGGQVLRTRARSDGHFRIRRVPAGTYTLTFVPDCGNSWTVNNVVVGNGETNLSNIPNSDECIVVGMLRIEDGRG